MTTEIPSSILGEEQLASPVIQENNRNPDGTFPKGVSGNPNGRPKGKTLKEFQAEQFRMMSDEEKIEWLKDVAKDVRWKMSEGMPKADIELSGKVSISNVLDEAENDGQTPPVERVEDPTSVQNQEQATAASEVQAEPSAGALSPEQVVPESDPQIPPTGIHD